LEKEEAVENVIGIAAPIRNYSRQVVAAMGIALPTGLRNRTDNLHRLIYLVKNACDLNPEPLNL
jgi:DNA-binding IclR family transcriptional regulator